MNSVYKKRRIMVRVVTDECDFNFENRINSKINELKREGHTIIDIKYTQSKDKDNLHY